MLRVVVALVELICCLQAARGQGKPDAFFANVALLCGALKSEGLITGAWSNAYGTDYQCITSYVDIGVPGPTGMATNIAYYVTGDAANRANSMKIVLNINNRTFRAAGKQRLSAVTKALFRKIGAALPDGLMLAMQSDKPFSAKQPYGLVNYEVDRGRIDTLKVSITAGQ